MYEIPTNSKNYLLELGGTLKANVYLFLGEHNTLYTHNFGTEFKSSCGNTSAISTEVFTGNFKQYNQMHT